MDIAATILLHAAVNYRRMPTLDDDEKAEVRRSIKRKLGLSSTMPLRPLVAKLTSGRWELRDAVVQMLDKLPPDRLKVLFDWRLKN